MVGCLVMCCAHDVGVGTVWMYKDNAATLADTF